MRKTAWVYICHEEGDEEQGKNEIIEDVLKLRALYPDAQVVNMFHELRGEKLPFEHTFYRDMIPYQDEVSLFAKAYEATDIILSLSASAPMPLVTASFFALYHSIASQLFYYYAYEYLLRDNEAKALILISSYKSGSTSQLLETKSLLDRMKSIIIEAQANGDITVDREYRKVSSPDNAIIFSCEDSDSGINYKTYMSIGKKLVEEGRDVYFCCLSEDTEKQLKKFTSQVVRFEGTDSDNPLACTLALSYCMDTLIRGFLAARGRGLLPQISYRAPSMEGDDALNSFLVATLFSMYEKFAHYMPSFEFTFASVENLATQGVRKLVAINEGDTASGLVLGAAKFLGLDSIGVSPILYSDHPASRFFPAKRHLVYGTQLAEIMIENGIDEGSIMPVGSVHYDQSCGRSLPEDVAYTRDLLPEWGDRPLVVIATENRSNQLAEIRPTLEALKQRSDLYVVIKLHPGDPVELFERLLLDLGSPSHFKLIPKCDVLAVIHASSLLITMSSNLVIEAAVMGNISLSYNFSSSNPVFDFVKEGLCFGANSPDECMAKIDMLVSDSALRSEALALVKNVHRFHASNDGGSVERIFKNIVDSGL